MIKILLSVSILSITLMAGCQSQNTSNPSASPSSVASNNPSSAPVTKVEFTKVKEVITQKCSVCHALPENRTIGKGMPTAGNVLFETSEQIKAKADRIKNRAVTNKTMPIGVVTLTD
ncbi:MAG: hypothetical protein ACK4IX_14340, partial [Candidatus Sericytochromatia bacterium]